MSSNLFGGHIYKVLLTFGKIKYNYGKIVSKIEISLSESSPVTLIKIFVNLSRKEYDKIIRPNRNNIRLSLKVSETSEPEFKKGKTIEIFNKELICLDEIEIDSPLEKNKNDSNFPSMFVLNCLTKSDFFNLVTPIENLYLYHPKKKEIFPAIGAKVIGKYQKTKEKVLEQFFIPPIYRHEAAKYIQEYLSLLHEPTIIYYDFFDGTLKVVTPIGNTQKPVKVKYITSTRKKNMKGYQKTISGGKDDKIDIVTFGPLNQTKSIITKAFAHGTYFNFTFFPMDTLFENYDKILCKKYYKPKKDIYTETNYAKDVITKMQLEETPVNKRYVMRPAHYLKEEANDPEKVNWTYDKKLISEFYNDAISILIESSWRVDFKKIMNLGGIFEINTDIKKIYTMGKYYLSSCNIILSRHEMIETSHQLDRTTFQCKYSLVLKSGLNVKLSC